MTRSGKRRLTLLLVSLASFAVLLALTELTGPSRRGDHAIQDILLTNWPPLKAPGPPQVALVTITEPTLARLPYRSPIDRGLLAEIVEALGAAGVRAMVFDILVDQATEPEKDARLLQAIRDFDGTVIMAWADHRSGLLEPQMQWLNGFIRESGAVAGFANLTTDADGVVRRFENRLPGAEHLSMAAALLKAGRPDAAAPMQGRIVWRTGTAAKAQAFPTLPAPGLLALSKVRPAALKALLGNKLVLVGADLPLVDRHTSSLAASVNPAVPDLTAGVEIHAHIVDQMAYGIGLSELSKEIRIALLVLLGAAAGLLAVSGLRFLWKGAAAFLFAAAYLGAAVGSLYEWHLLMPLIQPVVITILTFVSVLIVYSVYQSSDRQFIHQAFGQYISPKLVAQMIEQPEMLSVGGQRKELSFIFSDIAGFTSLSEAITPERLTSLLNDYLGGMSDLVVQHNGIVDKFIGDAVVAIFGAPGDDPDHRRNALACALAMDRFARDFAIRNNDVAMGETRIGVHSGEAIVGNFGGERRYDYTAMGDTMNIAARLESANKSFGTCLAVSGNVLGESEGTEAATIRIGDQVLILLGDFVFKGKNEPVRVYTPLKHHEPDWIEASEAAIRAVGDKAPDAAARLEELAGRHDDEPALQFHLNRAAEGKSGLLARLMDK